ncbi:hypothetical protein GBA52_008661 [Prunus armeniaca]|nr:hypothetical protein GBA52_008661 [Prunus armeniaca]
MPKPATMILRILLDKHNLPTMNVLYLVVLHMILPELLQNDSVLKIEGKQELVLYWNGKLVLSNRALAKLINGYKKVGDTCKLSELLLKIQKELCSLRGSDLCSDVIDTCIHLGWLETAHDLLDDMDAAVAPMGLTTFMSLLEAYYRGNMFQEAKALLKQMRKAGLLPNLSDEMVVSKCQPILDISATCTNVSSSTSNQIWQMLWFRK